jgi:hypothetical protein
MKNSSSPSNSQHVPTDPLFRYPLLRRILLFLAVFHFLVLLGYSLPKRLFRTDKKRDLICYYLVIERIHQNDPVYLHLPELGPHKVTFPMYVYPPVLSSLLGLMPILTFETFARIWTLFLYAAFWVYAVCLAQLAIGRVTVAGTLIAGLALTIFPGTHTALSLGQIDPILWALFGMALAIPPLRGAGLMAVSLVKPWAVWPLVWALREGWRVLAYALIVAAGSLVLGMLIRGPATFYAECLTWIRDVLPALGQGTWSAGNWSISFAALGAIRALGLWDYSGGILPLWARSWLLFCGIVVPILAGWFLRKQPMVFQLSVIGCAAVVLAPICWTSYLPVLLTPLAVIIGQKPAFLKKEWSGYCPKK